MRSLLIIFLFNFVILHSQNVEQIKKQIQNSGITIDQAKQIAKERGYSDDQIKSSIKNNDNNYDISNEADYREEKNSDINLPINKLDDDLIETDILIDNYNDLNSLSYFGYQIFQGDPSSFQSSDFGAIDPNYNIGPGDQIIVMLWGESQFRQQFKVDRGGYVFLPEIGQVFVNGLNLAALEEKFFQILSKAYSTLNPQFGEPTTFLDVSIADLRPLRVIVLGEVAQPGAYSVSPSSSLSSSLYYFNGPTTNGSLREIRLLRKGKIIGNIDFYDYLLSGNVPDDLRLQMDDVIFIPPRGETIAILGEINRQGLYELKKDEDLSDLIEIAGNLKVTAYTKRAQINRIVANEDRLESGFDRMLIDIDLDQLLMNQKKVDLYDGDTVKIYSIKDDYINYVTIRGSSVSRSGRYQLLPDMKVSDLINASDGLLDNVYLSKANLKRINSDLTMDLISIDLEKVFKGDPNHNIKLHFLDELFIYNTNELNNAFSNIIIRGPVKDSGVYELERGKTLGDLIVLTGGFKENVSKVKISVSRTLENSFSPIIYNFPRNNNEYIFNNQLSDSNSEINNFILSPNDIISIYSDPRDKIFKSVYIEGAVYFPGDYQIKTSNEKVSDMINRAGGLLPVAFPMASTFKRNNKIVKLSFTKILKNPNSKENFTVLPGDSINISTKSNIVDISGQVNQPGSYKFYENYSLKKYLEIAGGLTVNAEPKEVWISYPDGTSKQYKKFFRSPKVYDGSTISVGLKQDSEPFDVTEYAKEVSSILASLAQVYILFSAINN